MSASTHPSDEELNAYILGHLPQAMAVGIDSHISECDACCETIAGFTTDDDFVDLLQEARDDATDETFAADGTPTSAGSMPSIPKPLLDHPRYEVFGLIGRGGMGNVFQARHRMMNRTVALKVIKGEFVRRPESVDRFQREITAAAQLAHPNIVTAYDAEQAEDVHYLVMEHVDGVDLARMVLQRGQLPIDEACEYARQAAVGLQHAHERGMVHRDIKPHNLMVTEDGTVKILDFGLASLAPAAAPQDVDVDEHSELTAAGSIMGTPDFISPEQAKDARSADIRSDLYSLGSTLYFLLSGRPPFHEGSVMTRLQGHASGTPAALETLRHDLPEQLIATVARMMAKNPSERFQTPAEVAEALAPFLRSGPRQKNSRPKSESTMSVGRYVAGAVILAIAAVLVVSNWKESVADKLAMMKAPVAVLSEPPPGTARALLYTVEADALDGHSAAICDVGNIRIAIVNQDISRTRNASESINLVVTGPTPKRQSGVDSSEARYFTSIYADGEARCRFHGFHFTLTEKMIRFGTTAMFWGKERSPGMLILVDAETGEVITQPMKPAAASGAENDAQSRPEFDALDEQLFGSADEKEMLEWLAKTDPETVQRVAEQYVAQGQDDAAARVLALRTPPAPEALAALQLAKIQLSEGNLEKAADNYLKAYLITPATVNIEHLETIVQAQRLEEFMNVLTEDRLKKLGYNNDAEKIVLRLLNEESTRDHGYQFLRRLWKVQPRVRSGLLSSRHNEIWANVADPDYYLRATLLPSDIAAEGPGWERFTIESIDARGGGGYGVPMNLEPLLFDKSVLRNLADDVESAINQHPAWKAGHLVLAFLEAELGHEVSAVGLVEQTLADSENPVPPPSAWVFGQALEGKGDDLDRWVTRLYEINVAGARDPASPLRETAIGSLARLYDRSGHYGKARKLLSRLAEPESPFVVCAWSRSSTKETCTKCHKHARGLENYILMANALTDIGFPVDGRVALARIGSSFSNAYGSDEEWAEARTPVPDWEYQGKEAFQPARARTEQAITPQAIVEAFNRGVLAEPLPAAARIVVDDNPPDFPRLDLMIGVRGERGRSTLFSPVLDILAKVAAHPDTNRELDRLDHQLTQVPPGHRKSLDEMIAVTVLSFARNRIPEAKLRAEQTLAYVKTRDLTPVDIGLLFIARRALRFQSTKAIGEELADRARKAAALIDQVPSEALR